MVESGLLTDPLLASEGMLAASSKPGLGVELASDALERFAVDS